MIELFITIFSGLFLSMLSPGDMSCESLAIKESTRDGWKIAYPLTTALGGHGIVLVKETANHTSENPEYLRKDLYVFADNSERDFSAKFFTEKEGARAADLGICKSKGTVYYAVVFYHTGTWGLRGGSDL